MWQALRRFVWQWLPKSIAYVLFWGLMGILGSKMLGGLNMMLWLAGIVLFVLFSRAYPRLHYHKVRVFPTHRCLWGLLGLAALLAFALLMQWIPLPREYGRYMLSAEWINKSIWLAAFLVLLLWVDRYLARNLDALDASHITAERQLPTALALGVPTEVTLTFTNPGQHTWHAQVFDEADPALHIEGMPQTIALPAASRTTVRYTVTAQARGIAHFSGIQVRWLTRWRLMEICNTMDGTPQTVRIYPNFAAVARYAWLSGDRRLAQIGVKSWPRRGQGSDFRQLAEYRAGDALRHIDWKASLRRQRPIVREYQDERDQRILFLLDCGRRMRADEADGSSHFDQALNALMLVAHVALHDGDEVGAMTFGLPEGQQRDFAPRKGTATLHALMNRLHDIQPSRQHSDCQSAARRLLTLHPRRAWVIVLTNFQNEDAPELRAAMHLLRTRHLVVVASLRERVLADMAQQPLRRSQDAIDVAAAHLFAQNRSDAFARAVGHDALSLDVEPAQLAVALVNRYHAIKRAGML